MTYFKQVDMNPQEEEEEGCTDIQRRPGMSIKVSSSDNLELTVTKSGLEVYR